jgi:hypothetical protein
MRPVGNLDNLHTVKFYGGLLCVRCRSCGYRSVLGQEQLKVTEVTDKQPLGWQKLRCISCDAGQVEMLLPLSRAEADAFLNTGEDLRAQEPQFPF